MHLTRAYNGSRTSLREFPGGLIYVQEYLSQTLYHFAGTVCGRYLQAYRPVMIIMRLCLLCFILLQATSRLAQGLESLQTDTERDLKVF